jgi:hypothetical protein
MLTLVDTSVWVMTFGKNDPLDIESIVDFDDIVTCLPVIQEVTQGFRDERAFRHARDAMLSLPMVESPMDESVFLQAGGLYRSARRAGLTVRSTIDCLIAVCAIRSDLDVLHRDRDFEAIARVSGLRSRDVREL